MNLKFVTSNLRLSFSFLLCVLCGENSLLATRTNEYVLTIISDNVLKA